MLENKFDVSKRVFALAIIFLIGLGVFWGFRVMEIFNNINGNYPREITLEAPGKAYATPDTAKITLGVSTTAQKSEVAVKKNTDKMNKVIEEITKLGVDKKDIQTISYYLSPNYTYTADGGSKQDGYILDQTIEIKVKDFNKTGDIISATSGAGANMIGGIQFIIEDQEAVKEIARENAIKEVNAKAEKIEKATGLHLGKVVNYYEYESYDYGKGGYGDGGYMAAADVPMTESAPSMEPGQQEVSLTVSLTYRVK